MSRIQDAISPVRLGAQFRRLLVSSWTTNLADGIGLAAGPLLVASKTDDPLLVALAALLQRLPWMMFALYAGVVADRYDRRVVVAMSDLTRAAIMVVLVVMVATDSVNVGVVLAVMFLLGAAETFADTTASTLMPMLVESKDLGLANSRIMAGHIVVNQLAGPPIGAFLFAIGVAWPFVAEAVFFAFGAIVLTKISIPKPSAPPTRRRARHEIAEGLRWLWAHPPIRTLTITVVTFNVTFGAAWSVLVLYSSERLGLGDVGFGVLTAMSAIGGVLGSWGYPWVERRLGMGGIMRAGLIIETLTHLGLALTRSPIVAMIVLFAFGAHAAAWGTTATSIRHRAVPTELQGRVGAAYMLGVQGGMVIGAAIGGIVARIGGVTAPFWFAFGGSAMLVVAIWRSLSHLAHHDSADPSRVDRC